jgi:hypothetical protein
VTLVWLLVASGMISSSPHLKRFLAGDRWHRTLSNGLTTMGLVLTKTPFFLNKKEGKKTWARIQAATPRLHAAVFAVGLPSVTKVIPGPRC